MIVISNIFILCHLESSLCLTSSLHSLTTLHSIYEVPITHFFGRLAPSHPKGNITMQSKIELSSRYGSRWQHFHHFVPGPQVQSPTNSYVPSHLSGEKVSGVHSWAIHGQLLLWKAFSPCHAPVVVLSPFHVHCCHPLKLFTPSNHHKLEDMQPTFIEGLWL